MAGGARSGLVIRTSGLIRHSGFVIRISTGSHIRLAAPWNHADAFKGSTMIKVGTSGFSFKDWLGTVYPATLKSADMLPYYERVLGFDCTELNYTYYTMPSPGTMHSLLQKTASDFMFLVRTHADMTHNIWLDEGRTQLKDNAEVFDKFRFGIDPLVKAKRLGCVLIQFPIFFYPKPENFEYLSKCREWLRDIPAVAEFRNVAWNHEGTDFFLRDHNLGICIVDEPKSSRLMPFAPKLTTDIGYFRLHGRSKNWFGGDKALRYDYLYSKDELQEFIPHIRHIEEQSRVTFVAFNNCHAGSAARNALMTKQFLDLIGESALTTPQKQALAGHIPSPTQDGLGF
jgi:uncharacterized protein YecE (DUF72 family)